MEHSLRMKFAFVYVDIFIRFIRIVKDGKSHVRDWVWFIYISKWKRDTGHEGDFKLVEF